jgi:hypothetical protein
LPAAFLAVDFLAADFLAVDFRVVEAFLVATSERPNAQSEQGWVIRTTRGSHDPRGPCPRCGPGW